MMPTIRLDNDVFQGLKLIAEPFIDTPNTVIRRLLEDHGVLVKTKGDVAKTANAEVKNETNRQSVSLTPQPTYEAFLLHVLGTNFHGRGGKHEVTKCVIELMTAQGYIRAPDLERVSTGETKAENTIAWGRNALKEKGLISHLSPRGIWELTPEGVEKVKSTPLPITKE